VAESNGLLNRRGVIPLRRFESSSFRKQAVCLQQCRHPNPRLGLSQSVRADWCRAHSALGREAREDPSSVCNPNTGTQSPKHHDFSGVLTSKARKAKRRTVLPVFGSKKVFYVEP
jgi:hypothetical protein